MSASDTSQRYSTAVIVMHWAIAAAVVGLMVLGWWMQTIPKQPVGPRADAYNLHKSIGLVALLLMAVRLAWRVSHRPPDLPPLRQTRAATGGDFETPQPGVLSHEIRTTLRTAPSHAPAPATQPAPRARP